ncbi:isoaspartyl peptidase/L-asparaginase [Roseococcus sp. SDR]|uniref:isoaspartyl peptidase/L-asparaginase family protein n=1 Tax=Roseococcus sp. SDR TaxID=2835532 RepID=UPI001BCF66FA|nr:isoaspartyl peptidase/L-asparaginase [Roseococcus sp. SDR]MBS7788587.1 isoaspartyl peptidase/L-asparaginase [Roseococcus sp. SDR]MBV1843901.1 isoaspartyl peptidase/L-asparaginase [Roseococcus sp. SDR]
MQDTWTLAIHGGAGTIRREELTPEKEAAYRAGLDAALRAGGAVLEAGGSAEEAVLAAAISLEDCPLFNAGRGSTFTAAGTIEMDAALMTSGGDAGAVTGVTRIRNPILAARAVMRATPHVLLAGAAADDFAAAQGLAMEDPAYFRTEHRHAQLLAAQAAQVVALDHDVATTMGTIGAVARDRHGALAAATSTGGMTNKRAGRVGDTPILGAGTWADRHVAISCTGTGEAFMRAAAAHEVSALMRLAGRTLAEAAEEVALSRVPEAGGRGGLIAVDAAGNAALPFGTEGMYRGVWRAGEAPRVAIHAD